MLMATMLLLFGPAPDLPGTPAVIRVIGRGSVKTAPDLATIGFGVRGEGRSSDEAVRALTATQQAIETALGAAAEVRTGRLSVSAARDPACIRDDDDDRPRLSTGACAITGYVAEMGMTARMTAVGEAGTTLATIGRLGGTDPSLRDFELSRPRAAQQAALGEAMRDAQTQAAAIATASGRALGPIRRVEDQRAVRDGGEDIVVIGGRIADIGALANRVPVRLSPEPIETEATVVVEFTLVDAPR